MSIFGKLFLGFLLVVAVLALFGFWMTRGKKKEGEDEVLSDKTTENVLDLNDRFNRARYQDKDGQ